MKKILSILLAFVSTCASAATLNPVQLLNPAGSTSGQAIVSTGASSAPAWGSVSGAALAAQAANTVLANATASSASPTAFAMPSCSTSTSALNWTSGTGFTCGGSGFATLSGSIFTGPVTLNSGGVTNLNINVTSGNAIQLTNNSGGSYGFYNTTSNHYALSFAYNTDVATFYARPVFGSATPWDNSNLTNPAQTTGATFTGAITPSQTIGIVGTTTNNSAQAGSVGETICAQVTNGGSPSGCATNVSTPVSLTTVTPANVTSISLTAGQWDVCGNVGFIAAGSTTIAQVIGWISQTSATLPGLDINDPVAQISGSLTTGTGQKLATGCTFYKLASTTTVYLGAEASFGTSTMTATGVITATRRR